MLSFVMAAVLGVVLCQVAFVVTTVFLHRALSHRSLTLARIPTFGFRVLTWLMTGIVPRQWVAVHRKHHAHTDEVGDPHSPVVLGFPRVQFGNVLLYRSAARDKAVVGRYARDLPPDRWDRVLFDHGLLGLALGVGLLVALIGWQLAVVAAVVHTVLYLLGGGAINAIGHTWGKRPFENLATNNQWLAWLVAGEGLHNNHHAAATSSRMSLAKGEVDPAWGIIRLLVAVRWATLRQTSAGLAPASAAASAAS